MKRKRLISLFLTAAMAVSMMAGCGSAAASGTSASGGSAGTAAGSTSGASANGEVKNFTAFFATPGTEINDDNEIQNLIAQKTGVKVKETWLTGQTAQEAVGTLIAGGEYPDFIDGGDGTQQLYQAGALVALDDYIDKYPNIKNYFTAEEWDKLRQDDGHIYWIPEFSNINGEEKTCTHNDEAFWIQTRVLKWANYPKIKTMDQYFDLLEKYNAANPAMEDGTKNIPYTILCDDWRYFCLENAPQFLDGYPNDGSVIVNADDPKNPKIVDYNTTATAKKYFQKLNEEYKKGIVDSESFTQTYDEYIAKLSTGRVLGMIDQWWDFAYNVNDALKQAGLDKQGCDYVPLPITIDESVQNRWHCSGGAFNNGAGLSITTSCKDVDGALQFINDLLDQDNHNLRFWGVEGKDYEVDKDGKNAMKPDGQASEFYDGLQQDVKDTFDAYGVKTYVEMIGTCEAPGPWYPMWSFSGSLTTATPGGTAWTKMGECKHQYLPKVVMSDNFEDGWNEYMKAYNACNPQDFLSESQTELEKRVADAAKYSN